MPEVKHKPKTRGNGQGTAYKLPNGKWRAEATLRYETVVNENGKEAKKRIYKTKSGFKTKKEALAWVPDAEKEKEVKRNAVTFKDIYDEWQPQHDRVKSTMNCYAAAMNHFKPVWGMPIVDIDIDDLQECLDDCDKGKQTKKNMKTLVGLLYGYGIPRHYIRENLNLGQYVRVRDNTEANKKSALTEQEIEKLKKNILKVKYADYVYAQCYLGFRPSELLALDAKDYNAKEKAFIGGIKTEAGIDRVVTISPKIQNIVDRLVSGKTSGSVFCNDDGKRMSIKCYREAFYTALEECGIDNPITIVDGKEMHKLTPHSCRHSFATLMKRAPGADKDKLALIGHASDEMLRYYQDVNYDDLRKITDAL